MFIDVERVAHQQVWLVQIGDSGGSSSTECDLLQVFTDAAVAGILLRPIGGRAPAASEALPLGERAAEALLARFDGSRPAQIVHVL